ncbi:MAG: DUF3127 domain-containing protein [Alphaproteobacteria bacterium]|nr:DUF3127 domain-containing protein [Alphaproteobacteria bacterium]
MSYEIKGKIVQINDTQNITTSRGTTFQKREFVIEKIDSIPGGNDISNYIKFQITQKKTEILDLFKTGQNVNVFFNIRGNKYNKNGVENYITNLEAWKLEDEGTGAAKQQQNFQQNNPPINSNYNTQFSTPPPPPAADDDLPF